MVTNQNLTSLYKTAGVWFVFIRFQRLMNKKNVFPNFYQNATAFVVPLLEQGLQFIQFLYRFNPLVK